MTIKSTELPEEEITGEETQEEQAELFEHFRFVADKRSGIASYR